MALTPSQKVLQYHTELDRELMADVVSESNPHLITKEQVGLGNCDNTADLDKPVSTATQAAIDASGGGDLTVVSIDNTDSPYTVTATDGLIEVDASAGDVAITAPAIGSSVGRQISFVRTDTSSNVIDISGDANISGKSVSSLSLEAIPYGAVSWPRNSVTTILTCMISLANISTLTNLTVRGFWLNLDSTTTDVTAYSGVPNGGNWDLTSQQTYSSEVFESNIPRRFMLTNPVTLTTATDIFGVSITTADVKYGGPSQPTYYYSLTAYTGAQTNIPLVATNSYTYGLIPIIETREQYDVKKIIGGSTEWIETIA
jgi:hypothetical protein